ncbi:MAG: hypothetical protein JW993_14265 [Sedimentisphaerales bacterium]|nr:hypothetical protein [Sedimentisphaerales bacterium]
MTITNRLASTSEGTLAMDRRTGWLLAREQTTTLTGEMERSQCGPQPRSETVQLSLEITTTVERVE